MFEQLTQRYLASWPARIVALAAAVGVGLALTVWLPELWPYRIDIDVYRIGGRALLDGVPLYGPLPDTEIGANLPFTYPPIAAALFSFFAIMPLTPASAVLTLLSVLGLGWVLALVLSEVTRRPHVDGAWLALPVLALMLWLGPMRENIEFGQINVLLMVLVLTDALAGRGKPWRGWLTGLAVAIKLTPAVFLVYFLLRRDWRSLIMTVVSFLVYTAIGFALRPADSVEYWTSVLRDTSRIGNAGFPSNLSINGFVHRLGLEGTAASLTWFIVSALVGLAIMWVAWRLLEADQKAAAALVVGLIALFCSPVSWGHHWVWALPLLVVMAVWAAQGIAPRIGWLVLLVTGTYIFWALPQWWFPRPEEDEIPDWNLLQQLVGSTYLVWAAATLVVMAVRWRPAPTTQHADM